MPSRPSLLPAPLVRPLKQAITDQVIALFNNREQNQRPVPRRADSLFGPAAVAWRVHGDVVSMLVGGVAGLLLQMLHPAVLAGVWDHSSFRHDMQGRLRRTARFIAQTTYGDPDEARAAIARVRAIHAHVRGTLPDGTPYAANDPAHLAWVHVTETTCFLAAYRRYADPLLPAADQDRYFAEMARVAGPLGAAPIPTSRADARRLIDATRPQLHVDERTTEIARLVLTQRAPTPAGQPVQALIMQAAVDLLPDWARQMHALPNPALARPLLRASTFAAASTLRWAFR